MPVQVTYPLAGWTIPLLDGVDCEKLGVNQVDELTGAPVEWLVSQTCTVQAETGTGTVTVEQTHFSKYRTVEDTNGDERANELVRFKVNPDHLDSSQAGVQGVYSESGLADFRPWLFEVDGESPPGMEEKFSVIPLSNTELVFSDSPRIMEEELTAGNYNLTWQAAQETGTPQSALLLVYANVGIRVCPAQNGVPSCDPAEYLSLLEGAKQVQCDSSCADQKCWSFVGDDTPELFECVYVTVKP